MTNLQINQSFLFDRSYHQVIEDLNQWNEKLSIQLDEMYENLLLDMNQTYDDVHYFASFTNAILIEQENQLEKATSNEEIDMIQERINQILSEVQLLQSLSFRLNCDSVQLTGKLQINYNNQKLNSRTIFNSSELPKNTNYRFLISPIDAIELGKQYLPVFHLTSHDHECVLTFNVSNRELFLDAFDSYWNLFPHNNEIRILIPQCHISFIMGKLGETSRVLAKRYQLDQIKVFTNSCPKSNERILLIHGKRRDLIRNCIDEIYFNIEEITKNEFLKQNIQFYNPASLSIDEIDKIMITNEDYGGYQTRSLSINQSRLSIKEDEESKDDEDDEDDLWNENDDWWNCRDDNSESIQREIIISRNYAGVIIGLNATRIDRIKQKTGAYVYINGETSDLKRTVIIKGTRGQVDRAYAWIENLIERHKTNKLPIKPQRSYVKRKEK